MPRTKREDSYFDRLENDIKSNQNTLSLVLGALIVIVVGILLFNYFNKQEPQITPESETVEQPGDVNPTKLPGKYTVKEGDTLFTIAEKYYSDGYKYEEIAKANELDDVNIVTVGQELTIPKVEGVAVVTSPEATTEPVTEAQVSPAPAETDQGTGGSNTTIWGPRIEGNEYTVVEGDWLSTIAARAYNNIQAYTKIAQANNIQNPDLIVPGQVLKLPR